MKASEGVLVCGVDVVVGGSRVQPTVRVVAVKVMVGFSTLVQVAIGRLGNAWEALRGGHSKTGGMARRLDEALRATVRPAGIVGPKLIVVVCRSKLAWARCTVMGNGHAVTYSGKNTC